MFSTKMRWVKFAESEDHLQKLLQGKEVAPLRVNNKAVLLVSHEEQYFLVKNRCPHQGITLENASCEDGYIVCPWHRYAFSLETGRGAGLYLEKYPVELREDGYYAGFEYFSLF